MTLILTIEQKQILKRWSIIFLIIGTLAYGSNLAYVLIHEQTHQQIFSYYRITSEYHINYLTLSGYTQPTGGPDCEDYCTLSHNITEAIGYHTAAIIFAMWSIFMSWLVVNKLFI